MQALISKQTKSNVNIYNLPVAASVIAHAASGLASSDFSEPSSPSSTSSNFNYTNIPDSKIVIIKKEDLDIYSTSGSAPHSPCSSNNHLQETQAQQEEIDTDTNNKDSADHFYLDKSSSLVSIENETKPSSIRTDVSSQSTLFPIPTPKPTPIPAPVSSAPISQYSVTLNSLKVDDPPHDPSMVFLKVESTMLQSAVEENEQLRQDLALYGASLSTWLEEVKRMEVLVSEAEISVMIIILVFFFIFFTFSSYLYFLLCLSHS